MPWDINRTDWDRGEKVSWDGVDQEEFDSIEQWREVHSLHKSDVDEPDDEDEVANPLGEVEDSEFVLVHEALQSAHDAASRIEDIDDDTVEEVRNYYENLQEEWFPDKAEENPLDADQEEDEEEESSMPDKNREKHQVKDGDVVYRNFTVGGKDIDVKEADNGDRILEVPIQAVSEDRDGDIISEKGQEVVINQLKSGEVPMFPNHGLGDTMVFYDFREIFGQWVDGRMTDNQVTFGTVRLRDNNDMADELEDLIQQDMPVSFSVGFRILDAEDRNDAEGVKIHDLDLLEVSAVGIPSNPEANPQAQTDSTARAAAAVKGILDKYDGDFDAEKVGKAVSDALKGDIDMSDESSEQDNPEQDSGNNDNDEVAEFSDKQTEQVKSAVKEALDESKLDVKITADELDEVMGIVGGAAQGAEEDLVDGIEGVADLDDSTMEDIGGVVESVMQDMVDNVESELEQLVEQGNSTDEDDEDEEDSSSPDEQDDERPEEEDGLSDEDKTGLKNRPRKLEDNPDEDNDANETDKDEAQPERGELYSGRFV